MAKKKQKQIVKFWNKNEEKIQVLVLIILILIIIVTIYLFLVGLFEPFVGRDCSKVNDLMANQLCFLAN